MKKSGTIYFMVSPARFFLQNFSKISSLIWLLFIRGIATMLKLINKTGIPPDFLTKRGYKRGGSELIFHSRSLDNEPDELRFESTGTGICMVFNYGGPVVIRSTESDFRILTRQQNILNLDAGTFELSPDGEKNWLIRLITIPSELFEHILRHFQPEKLDLRIRSFDMMFGQNLHIGDEISHNLHAFHAESVLPESAGVYTYGRLLIFLSLQFSQHVTNNKRKSRQLRRTQEATITSKMYHAEQIIRSDFTGRYTLPDLAKLVGTNECYLKKQFKNVFGMPVRAYQRKIKMAKANDLLLNTTLSIDAISAGLGYLHTTHFTAAYKKYYRYTPGEARSRSVGNVPGRPAE